MESVLPTLEWGGKSRGVICNFYFSQLKIRLHRRKHEDKSLIEEWWISNVVNHHLPPCSGFSLGSVVEELIQAHHIRTSNTRKLGYCKTHHYSVYVTHVNSTSLTSHYSKLHSFVELVEPTRKRKRNLNRFDNQAASLQATEDARTESAESLLAIFLGFFGSPHLEMYSTELSLRCSKAVVPTSVARTFRQHIGILQLRFSCASRYSQPS